MELSTLKKLRKVVPGTVFLFFSVPAYQFCVDDIYKIDDSLKFPLEGYGAVLAIIIGSFFGTLKVRRLRNKKTHKEINENIKTRLLMEGLAEHRSEDEKIKIKNSRKLMHIFYHLIDNDQSLKEKSKLVRDNGLIWTSTADVAILGCFFSWVYLILILIYGIDALLVSAGLMGQFLDLRVVACRALASLLATDSRSQPAALPDASHPSRSWVHVLSSKSSDTNVLPVLTTKAVPWSDFERIDCGWRVPVSVQGLADGLSMATTLSDEARIAMGVRGHDLVRTQYSWESVAKRFLDLYASVQAGFKTGQVA